MAEAEAGLGAALLNVAAKINVGVTLADPAIKKIVFEQGGMVVRPSCFAEVAKAITADRIKVVVVKNLSTTGVYDAAVAAFRTLDRLLSLSASPPGRCCPPLRREWPSISGPRDRNAPALR